MANSQSSLPHGALDLLVLIAVRRGPKHGYGILLHVHEASDNLLRIEEGSLYPALHRLEQADLLESEWRLSENNRKAKYYKLTRKGRSHLEDAEFRWERVVEGVDRVLKFV